MLEAAAAQAGPSSRGLVVANEVDLKRSHLLVARAQRLHSTTLLVTNHDALRFPDLHVADLAASDPPAPEPPVADLAAPAARVAAGQGEAAISSGLPYMENARTPLLFDRVLCDVPCSGDGTLRKAPAMWRWWSARAANLLHTLQLGVAARGVQLLEVGGRLVYSTCRPRL